MKPAAHGIWRPVRCFFLVACAGGILAADNTWISPFDFGFARGGAWFSSAPLNDSPTADIALSASLENGPRAQLSMGQLINGLLFSRPARGWRLTSFDAENNLTALPREISTFAWMPRNSEFMVETPRATSISMKVVSDGFAKESSSGGGILPTGPGGPTFNWINSSSGNWTDAVNWDAASVPNAANVNVNITKDIASAVTVNLGATAITIGDLTIGDTNNTHSYSISASGGSLTFDNSPNSSSTLTQTATSHGDTISAPIFLKNDLTVSNSSTTNPLTISGNISSSVPTGGFHSLSFAGGTVNVSGNITTGTSTQLSVQVSSGLVTLAGTNAYNGSTSVSGGTLLINGDNSGATGTVYVFGGGTLGGGTLANPGTIGGQVFAYGGTITGGTDSGVGTLTLMNNLRLRTGEGDGTYLANLSGSLSDLLAITGTFFIGGQSALTIVGGADGTTTYTLATFGSLDGVMFNPTFVSGVPTGYDLVYHDHDMQLVPTPIPEPGTWLGGALALGAIGFVQRRRLRRLIPGRAS